MVYVLASLVGGLIGAYLISSLADVCLSEAAPSAQWCPRDRGHGYSYLGSLHGCRGIWISRTTAQNRYFTTLSSGIMGPPWL